jgi:serine/threonine protein kinase
MQAAVENARSEARTARWRAGDSFAGGLRIDSLLAMGATNAVYAVTDPSGTRGALKVPVGPPSDPMRTAYAREARISTLAATAGSPRVRASGVADDGTPWLLVELMTGLTLEQRQYRRGGKFDPLTALFIAERVAASLDRLHELGIVHQDVRPANVFITAHGDIRLFDFGLATSFSDRFAAYESSKRSPCAISDPGTDIFCLGATLACMLTGSAQAAGRFSRRTTTADALDRDIEGLPSPVLALLETALSPQPRKRFVSASAFRDAIADVLAELTPL